MITKIAGHALTMLMLLLLGVPINGNAEAESAAAFKQEQLEQLVAPIALYPDSLVSQVLMASTYPLEVLQAERFVKQNKDLKGDALTRTLEQQPWDPSVKSLTNFPQVLTMMSEKLDWTQKLGDAFLSQQSAVMATIQSLRARANTAGNLKTTAEQKVIVEEQTSETEEQSPLGPMVAAAAREGYKRNTRDKTPVPYHGYYYKILKAQGRNASGGAYSYLVKDKMIGGFAVMAYPAQYGNSGVMTFTVNHEGRVFQKNLGKDTTSVAVAMTQYNPDSTWIEVKN